MKNGRYKKIFERAILLFSTIAIIVGAVGVYSNSKNTEPIKIAQDNMAKSVKQQQTNKKTLDINNCSYEFTEDGGAKIVNFYGYADSIIIPNQIGGRYITSISPNAFKDSYCIESIIVNRSMKNIMNDINGFCEDESLSDENHVVYTTTKEYTNQYIQYLKLNEEQKKNVQVIPQKFKITDTQIYNPTTKSISTVESKSKNVKASAVEIPSRWSLYNEGGISKEVEDQGDEGICYAYALTKSIETFIQLHDGGVQDLSEEHMAVVSRQGAGGGVTTCIDEYLNKQYGPIRERSFDYWNKIFSYCCDDTSVSDGDLDDIIDYLKTIPADYIVTGVKRFSYFDGNDKQDSNQDKLVEINRNRIKEHIMTKGSVYTDILAPTDDYEGGSWHRNGNGDIVLKAVGNDEEFAEDAHSVSIVGWDDDFEDSGFESRGAYLCLNSWGSNWGNGGLFWIMYDDFYVETSAVGITGVQGFEEKIDIEDSSISIEDVESQEYTGREIMPPVVVKDGTNVLQNGVDYELEYSNNTDVGSASVVIKGIGKYKGSTERNFEIYASTIVDSMLVLERNEYEYTGNEVRPTIRVEKSFPNIEEATVLTEGTDYNVEYSNNTQMGTATITVSGLGGYVGQATINFTIGKGIAEYVTPTGLKSVKGRTLKDVALPNGFSWEDDLSTSVGEPGENRFKCKYIPADTSKYKEVTGIDVTITVLEKLSVSSNVYNNVAKSNKEYIAGVELNTTVEQFENNIITDGVARIADKDGNEITDKKSIIKTGMIVVADNDVDNTKYTLIVSGDINCDGKIDETDLSKLSRYLVGMERSISEAGIVAADVYSNRSNLEVNNVDLLRLARYLAGFEKKLYKA